MKTSSATTRGSTPSSRCSEARRGIALSRARELDARLRAGKRKAASGLFGVPLAIKDNIFFGGFPTTAATFYFKDFVPSLNADIVDDAMGLGCIPLGKTNLHELALGGTSAASYFGPVRNPHDVERVAGGSSGGSAVSVALSKGPVLGLGTDTGGSIRVPAALCGIMGFKPTLGVAQPGGGLPAERDARPRGAAHEDHARHGEGVRAAHGRAEAARPSGRGGRRIKVGVLTGHFQEETEEKVSKNFWRAVDRMEASGDFRGGGGPDGLELREVHEGEGGHPAQGGSLVLRGARELGEGRGAR